MSGGSFAAPWAGAGSGWPQLPAGAAEARGNRPRPGSAGKAALFHRPSCRRRRGERCRALRQQRPTGSWLPARWQGRRRSPSLSAAGGLDSLSDGAANTSRPAVTAAAREHRTLSQMSPLQSTWAVDGPLVITSNADGLKMHRVYGSSSYPLSGPVWMLFLDILQRTLAADDIAIEC